MITKFCLSKDAYFQMLQNECFGIDYEEEFKDLEGWVKQGKEYYDVEFIGLNYFLAKNLEVYLKRQASCQQLVEFVYSLDQKLIFTIQEFDYQFIDNLMNQLPNPENSLDEDLISVIGTYSYE